MLYKRMHPSVAGWVGGDATTSMTSIFMFIENKSQIHNEVV